MSQLRISILFVLFCGLAVTAGHIPAQITEGNLTGNVLDPDGAGIAGATVTVRNEMTGAARTATSNARGSYRVEFLQPGTYLVTGTHAGFANVTVQGVKVEPGLNVRADLHLPIGAAASTVQVRSDVLPIDVDEGRLTTMLSERQVEDLPTPNRDVYSLALLSPGVTATLAPVISDTQSNVFNYGFSANGATARGNNFVIDGVSNNNEWLGGTPALSPSVEAIESFQVETANFSPEYGRDNGAIVIATTKAGTNQFHGSAYDYLHNPATDASNRFDSPLTGKTAIHRNDFGASLGGPILKDKTFFFVNYEGVQETAASTLIGTGETPQYRLEVATYRPTSIANAQFQAYPSGPCVPGTSADTGSIFDESLPLSVVAQYPTLQQFVDGPPNGIPDVCESSYLYHQPIRSNQYLARVDQHFTANDTFFARYLQDFESTDTAPQELGSAAARGFLSPMSGNYPSILISEIHIFSPHVVNDLRVQYARSGFGIGFEAPNSSLAKYNYPDLYFDNGLNLFGGATFTPRNFVFNNFTENDALSIEHGNHAVMVGFDLERLEENSNYHSEDNGFYEFQDQFTFGNDGAYYQTAAVNPVTGKFASTPRHFRQTWFSFFAADDWRVEKRLTFNLGIRYDLYGVPSETNGILANMTLASGTTPAARIGNAVVGRVSTLFAGDHNNFSPRVGFAYDGTGRGTTIFRGAAAMAYLAPYSNLYTNASRFDPPDVAFPFVFPYYYGGAITYGVPAETNPAYQTGLTPQGGIPGTRINVSGIQRGVRTAYSEQFFLGIEQKLRRNFYLSANYDGTVGRKLYIRDDINRFTGDRANSHASALRYNQQWGSTTFVENGPGSSYNGMNVQLQRVMANHYAFTVNYTFGKALDEVSDPGLGDFLNMSNGNYNGTMDEQNPRLDYGPSDFDVRQRLTANSSWLIPTPGTSLLARQALGGWQLNGIVALQSGRPFSVWCENTIYCDYNGDGDGLDRPNTPGYGNIKRGLKRSDYIRGMMSVNDFTDPNNGMTYTEALASATAIPEGKDGNLGRNTFRGPGYADVDASLFKAFQLPRQREIEFRAEAFNLLNRVNLYLPDSILSGSALTFGKSTAAFPSRNMQFALKYIF